MTNPVKAFEAALRNAALTDAEVGVRPIASRKSLRIIEAHLEKVGDAASEVQVAIRKYVEAHEAVLKLDGVPNSVLKLAARGVATGNRAREQWNVLGDDGHVMSYAMERHFEGMKADE